MVGMFDLWTGELYSCLGNIWFKVLAFAFAGTFAAASGCSAQSASCISIRALNSKTAKPLRNVSITMNTSVSRGRKLEPIRVELLGSVLPILFRTGWESHATRSSIHVRAVRSSRRCFGTLAIWRAIHSAEAERSSSPKTPKPGELVTREARRLAGKGFGE